MIKKFLVFSVLIVLLVVIVSSVAVMNVSDDDVVLREKQWAKILSVETVSQKVKIVDVQHWEALVLLDNKQSIKIPVHTNPIPQVGQCLPLNVAYLEKGGIYAVLDVEEWRYGNALGACPNDDE